MKLEGVMLSHLNQTKTNTAGHLLYVESKQQQQHIQQNSWKQGAEKRLPGAWGWGAREQV